MGFPRLCAVFLFYPEKMKTGLKAAPEFAILEGVIWRAYARFLLAMRKAENGRENDEKSRF